MSKAYWLVSSSRKRISFIRIAAVIAFASCLSYMFLHHPASQSANAAQDYTVVGQPSITADFMNRVLAHNHSPASGEGDALYRLGMRYRIDPAYALAFFMHESSFGTRGMAVATHSLGNIRASDGYAQIGGYRAYRSWDAGFEDWYRLIANIYVAQWDLSTVDQIIPVYAPPSDNNDDAAYIQAVKSAVDTWRSGTI